MKFLSSLILILLTCNLAFAKGKKTLSKEEFARLRWNKIYKLTQEEIATINQVRRKTPKLMYRLFELKSEIVKLFKEKENREFMAKKLKYGSKVKRENSFKKTLKLYKEANAYGLSILKKYPNTPYKAGIYYTLALNSRDFSYDKKELGYLRAAIKYSSGQNKVNYLARTSLAEYYYNKKNWKAAVYQYEIVLKNADDEWYSKNLLNYGWCLLKAQKFGKAIDSLEKSYQLSKDDFYIDVRDQAMTGLISFYVLGKEIDRGIKFIDKNANGDPEYLLKLAQKASGKGYFKDTENIVDILESRLKPADKKSTELYADFRLFQFDLYKQYHKPKKLMKIAKMFPKVKFTEYQQEDAVRKISDVVGAKQVILKKDFSKHSHEFDEEILRDIIVYFDILSAVNIKETAQYEYFKAETYYSVELFKEALNSYKTSISAYDKTPSKADLRHKNLDAVFSCIENINFSAQEKRNELEYAYLKYLGYWPKDSKAQKIYPRLYGLYASVDNYNKMQSSLDRYISHFKKDKVKQQELFRLMLDSLIKKEETKLLANKITMMQKGYLAFTKVEVKKSETILANILFKQFQQLNKEGKPEKALAGYQQIHFTEYYPASVKGEAAFNMGMIYTDLQDNNNALKWYEKSFAFFNNKEKDAKRVFLEKMALRTALLHNFLNAAKLNKFILKSYCAQKKKNTKIFQAAIRNDLANDYISKTMFTIKQYRKCSHKFPMELKKEIMTHLYENKHENDLFTFIKEHKLNNTYADENAYYTERLYWSYYGKSKSKEKQMLYYLKAHKHKNATLLINALKQYQKFKKKAQKFAKQRVRIKSKNPNPNDFIKDLTTRINKMKSLTSSADQIFQLGHGQVSVLVYDELTKLASNFSDEVTEYHIPINDANFQKQFKAEMLKISNNMLKEAKSIKLKSQNLVEKYELLISKREDSHLSKEILDISDIRVPASDMAITFGLGK